MASSATSSLSSAYGTLDVNSMVAQLMQVERNPQLLLQNRQAKINTKATALESIAADVAAIQNAAAKIDASSEWEPLKTTSSSSAVTTSATTGSITGSLSFSITKRATNQKLYSTSTLSSTATSVTGASRLLVAAGLGSMGFGTVTGDPTLALGAHTIAVTQASAAATKTGTVVGGTTLVEGVNDSLEVSVGGATYTLDLASGTYTGPEDLADAVNDAISALGPGGPKLAASVDGGKLVLKTTNEGSAASIQVTGGTALTDLGLTTDASAITGTDGKVTVDGTETVLTDIGPGSTVALAAPAGAINATLAGGVRTGSASVANVDTSSGSLASVVSAINGSNAGVAAAAIKVGEGAYRLQIESKATGVAGRLNMDMSAFTVGGFSTLAAGGDAEIQIEGATPYSVTSSSNTFTDVLPGVSFTLAGSTNDVVTVTATRDADTLADRIAGLVQSLNTTFADIKVKTSYNATSKIGGALQGDSTVQRARSELLAAITGPVTSSNAKQAGAVGLTVSREGQLVFDKAAFQAAYAADPAGVQRLFVSAPGDTDKGITQRLADAADKAVDSTIGYLTTSAKQQRETSTGIGKQIDAFEARMVIRETALKLQWNAINVALERLQQQNSSLLQSLSSLSADSGE